MDAIDVVKGMLSSSISKDKWTKCPMFRCVMNTGWSSCIVSCLKGRTKTAGGYKWNYVK